jgi:lysophospholipase L1-like esterase
MKWKKIEISFYFVMTALFLSGLITLLCSCSKENATNSFTSMPINTANTDSMPGNGTKTYLALGDSYTIGTSVGETDRYPIQTAALLKTQGIDIPGVEIIATNGWTTTNLINGINASQLTGTYDVVTLLIGVNNQYQGGTIDNYKQEFTTLIQKSIQLAGGRANHVFIISIPDYSVTPFARGRNTKQIATEIDAFNNANKAIADTYKTGYLNVTEDSRQAARDPSLIASDSLHFSGKEYAIWSGKLVSTIKTVLQ